MIENVIALPHRKHFQAIIDGKETDLFLLKNANDMIAAITNYGGRIAGVWVPDKEGRLVDVVIGHGSVDEFATGADTYYGALVGRYGNRIAKGKFRLGDQEFKLAINNGINHLHGGNKGFSRVVWEARQLSDDALQLTYVSKDGEEGYPGMVKVTVIYTITSDNSLHIRYEATTDKTTIINLTNHSYFNLNGEGSGSIYEHLLYINARHYIPIDDTWIPYGEIAPVEGTPFDFQQLLPIGKRIDNKHEQLIHGKGYDHSFVFDQHENGQMHHAATVIGDRSGIVMKVLTREPGMQFYSGNFMEGTRRLKNGSQDDYRTAFCLETQHFPDSPNQPQFPSTILEPGNMYRTETIYQFSTQS